MRYDFECGRCGRRFELSLPFDGELLSQWCGACGGQARRVFAPARHRITFRAGWDGALDAGFDSKRQRDEHLAKNDLVMRDARV